MICFTNGDESSELGMIFDSCKFFEASVSRQKCFSSFRKSWYTPSFFGRFIIYVPKLDIPLAEKSMQVRFDSNADLVEMKGRCLYKVILTDLVSQKRQKVRLM